VTKSEIGISRELVDAPGCHYANRLARGACLKSMTQTDLITARLPLQQKSKRF
jgi:hypothetical protein